jgi:hypothetical protein
MNQKPSITSIAVSTLLSVCGSDFVFDIERDIFTVPSKLGPRSISLRSTEPDVVSLGLEGNDRYR